MRLGVVGVVPVGLGAGYLLGGGHHVLLGAMPDPRRSSSGGIGSGPRKRLASLVSGERGWLLSSRYLNVMDPWRAQPDYEVPYIELQLIRIKEASGSIIEGWDAKEAA